MLPREAAFPGGFGAWRQYLSQNLNAEVPVEQDAPTGRYSVRVTFVVEADGRLAEVSASNDPGYGTATEALRVILKSPLWNYAVRDGKPVRARMTQLVTFDIQ